MKEPYYKGYIASYEQYLSSSPYVREVMARLAPYVDDARSMLDIGAGTGVFSLAVPEHIAVTAVESSPAMCEVIAQRAGRAGREARKIKPLLLRAPEVTTLSDFAGLQLLAASMAEMEGPEMEVVH